MKRLKKIFYRVTTIFKNIFIWNIFSLAKFFVKTKTEKIIYNKSFLDRVKKNKKNFTGLLFLLIFVALVLMFFINSKYGLIFLAVVIFFLFVKTTMSLSEIWIKRKKIYGHIIKNSILQNIKKNKSISFNFFNAIDFNKKAIEIIRNLNEDDEYVLGEFDQDGRFVPSGDIKLDISHTSKEKSLERIKSSIKLVVKNDILQIKKDFFGRKLDSLNEAYNLMVLYKKGNFPILLSYDYKKAILYESFIYGNSLKEIIADNGAEVRDIDLLRNKELAKLTPMQRDKIVVRRSLEKLHKLVSKDIIRNIEKQINVIHKENIAGYDLKYGNVIISKIDGKPYLIDFECPIFFKSKLNPLYFYKRDNDRERFNFIFNEGIMTYSIAKKKIDFCKTITGDGYEPWYSPVYFGYGLSAGGIYGPHTGIARWLVFNRKYVPDLYNKTVLDLGSNHALYPLMMLRDKEAKKVIAFEISKKRVKQAMILKEIFEWIDNKKYNLKIYNRDMLDIVNMDLEKIDIVTAFCSLYYLDENEMNYLINYFSKVSSTLIVQGNIFNSGGELEDRKSKSIPEFLVPLLVKNGFTDVKWYNKKFFSRPIIIGRK